MLKKYPFIKQDESKNCGIACMMMIFKYYNGYVNKLKLTELSKTDKNGTTAYHIIYALKYYGFSAEGIKCNIKDLNNNLFPAIAHVTLNKTYNHYIVIYEKKKDYFIIADPSDKVKKIKSNELETIYNDVLITATPKKQLPKYFESVSKIDFCTNLIKNYKSLIIKLLCLSFLITFFSIIISFYFKFMIDNILEVKTLNLVLIFFLHFYILNTFSNYFRNKLLIYINKYIDYDITTLTFKQIINLPYRYYSSRTTGDIISRINDINILNNSITKFILIISVDLVLIIISLISLFFISNKLFLIALISVLLYIAVIIIFHFQIKKQIENCQTHKATINSYMIEKISNYENIKGINISKIVTDKFNKKYIKNLNANLKLDNILNKQIFFKNIINDLCFIFVVYIGCIEINKGNLSIGSLLAFNTLLNYFLTPIKEIIEMENEITSSFNALERILELYYNENSDGIIETKIKGDIKIKNLSFSYDDKVNILKNVNLDIKHKEKVLIIGQSGSGKSTILKLIKGYFKTNRNNIFIDDIDINDYKSETINENICYISQNENLYTDTLYNNIKLNRDIDEHNIIEISKICNIDFLDNKLGYNMLIEENGFNISGGQKQRVVLARSLLNDFNILLIDEATNQIDYKLERKILNSIFEKFKDKTIIVVSHRNENIDLFDKVINLENGKIKGNT